LKAITLLGYVSFKIRAAFQALGHFTKGEANEMMTLSHVSANF